MEYPGRVIIIGQDTSGEHNVVVYAVTGRSASSQARKLECRKNVVWTRPTDVKILEQGNPDLLVYPALSMSSRIIVSNGKQTQDIVNQSGGSAKEVLDSVLKKWEYEPDAPIFTPRISGCILGPDQAALHIIKRGEDGSPERRSFCIRLCPGTGQFIATYSGENRDPLKPFQGSPPDIQIREKSAQDMAGAVYDSLGPDRGLNDYRVAVACVFAKKLDMRRYSLFLINREERNET
jgi:IMP cyclohydrolase